MPERTEAETYAFLATLKKKLADANKDTPPNKEEAEAAMKFLGVSYDGQATFHYAYMSGGVMYKEPGK